MLADNKCPSCKVGELRKIPNLEGSFCTRCAYHTDEEVESPIPSPETVAPYRGVPTLDLQYGSTTKSVKVKIPLGSSDAQARRMIDDAVLYEKYLIQRLGEEGIDLEPKRKGGGKTINNT